MGFSVDGAGMAPAFILYQTDSDASKQFSAVLDEDL